MIGSETRPARLGGPHSRTPGRSRCRPIGEMRKIQSAHSLSGLGPVGIWTTACRVHRPHLEGVDRAVGEAGDRMDRGGGADGYSVSPPVELVLVIRDGKAANSSWALPRTASSAHFHRLPTDSWERSWESPGHQRRL